MGNGPGRATLVEPDRPGVAGRGSCLRGQRVRRAASHGAAGVPDGAHRRPGRRGHRQDRSVLGRPGVDFAEKDGHLYSDKAPAQPVLAVVPYLAYKAVGGESAEVHLRVHGNYGLWWISLWSAALPLAALVVVMARLAAPYSERWALPAAVAMGFGSLLFPFGVAPLLPHCVRPARGRRHPVLAKIPGVRPRPSALRGVPRGSSRRRVHRRRGARRGGPGVPSARPMAVRLAGAGRRCPVGPRHGLPLDRFRRTVRGVHTATTTSGCTTRPWPGSRCPPSMPCGRSPQPATGCSSSPPSWPWPRQALSWRGAIDPSTGRSSPSSAAVFVGFVVIQAGAADLTGGDSLGPAVRHSRPTGPRDRASRALGAVPSGVRRHLRQAPSSWCSRRTPIHSSPSPGPA